MRALRVGSAAPSPLQHPAKSRDARSGARRLALFLALTLALGACAFDQPPGKTGAAGNSEATLRLAERTEEAGDYTTALKLYQDLQAVEPTRLEVLLGLGRSFAGLQMHSRAEQAFRAALTQAPGNRDALYGLGKSLYHQDRLPEAEAAFRQTLQADPKFLPAYSALGASLDRQSKHKEAQQAYQDGLALDPTNLALLNNLGLSLALSGDYQRSIALLKELVNDPHATPRIRQNLALAYGLSGNFEAAAAIAAIDLPEGQVAGNVDFYRMAMESLR